MERFYRLHKGRGVSRILDDVIGKLESSGAAYLTRHDLLDIGTTESTTPHDTRNLRLFGTIDDEATRYPLAPLRRLEQQWYYGDDVSRLGRIDLFVGRGPDHRMQDRFEFLPVRIALKNEGTHADTIERSGGGDIFVAKRFANLCHGGTACSGQAMGQRVGIDDGNSALREESGNRRFAASNAACQADQDAALSGHRAGATR